MTSSADPDEPASLPTALVVRTVRLDLDPRRPAARPAARPTEPVTWLRRGEGLVGWGVAAEIRTRGATRFADADKWWTRDDRPRPWSATTSTSRAPGWSASARSPSPTSPATPCSSCPGWSSAAAATAPGSPPSARDELGAADADGRRPSPPRHRATWLRRRRARRRALDGGRGGRRRAGSAPATSRRSCSRATWSRPPTRRSTSAGRCAGSADDLPDVLDLPRRRDVRRDARDAGAPRARPGDLAGAGRHDPAYRRRRARPRARRHPGPLVEGPRGARVRRPLGRRRARAALLVDERARGAVRAAPAQRHAPRHRRRRRRARRRHRLVAPARRVAAPLGRRRRHARPRSPPR